MPCSLAELQTRQTIKSFCGSIEQSKEKEERNPQKKKRTRNRESNRSGVEMHSLNAMLNKKKEKKKKKKNDRNDRTCRVLFPSRYTRVASSHGWVFSMWCLTRILHKHARSYTRWSIGLVRWKYIFDRDVSQLDGIASFRINKRNTELNRGRGQKWNFYGSGFCHVYIPPRGTVFRAGEENRGIRREKKKASGAQRARVSWDRAGGNYERRGAPLSRYLP